MADQELQAWIERTQKELNGETLPKPINDLVPASGVLGQGPLIQAQPEQPAPTQEASGMVGTRAKAGLLRSPEEKLQYLQSALGPENVKPLIADNQIEGFQVMTPDGPRLLDKSPETFTEFVKGLPGDIADVSGAIIETAPGLVASGLAAPAGPLAAAGAGAVTDINASLLRSQMAEEFTGIPQDPVESGKEALIAGSFGAAGEAGGMALRGITRVTARNLGSANQKIARLAKAGAADVGEQAIGAVPGKTGRDIITRSEELERLVRMESGESDFSFSVGQRTGLPTALGDEKLLIQSPVEQGAFRRAEDFRNIAVERTIDNVTKRLVDNPDLLGKTTAGRTLADAVSRRAEDLRVSRTAEVSPKYEKAFAEAEAAGGASVIDPSLARAFVADQIKTGTGKTVDEILAMRPSELADVLGKSERVMLRDYKRLSGKMDARQINSILKDTVQRAKGTKNPLSDHSVSGNVAYAKQLASILNEDVGNAAELGVPGAAALRDARRTWALMTEEIETFGSDIMNQIFKFGADAKPEEIIERIAKLDETALKNVLDTVGSAGPDAKQLLKAQLLRHYIDQGKDTLGAREATRELVSEALINPFDAKAAFRGLQDNIKKINVLAEGDQAYKDALNTAIDLTRRLGSEFQVRGAQTKILQGIAESGGRAGDAISRVSQLIFGPGLFGNVKLAKLLTTKKGAQKYNKFLRAAAFPSAGDRAKIAATRAANRLLSELALMGALEEQQ